jgi:hypothetical protein
MGIKIPKMFSLGYIASRLAVGIPQTVKGSPNFPPDSDTGIPQASFTGFPSDFGHRYIPQRAASPFYL